MRPRTAREYDRAISDYVWTAMAGRDVGLRMTRRRNPPYAHMIAGTALESLGRRDEAIEEYKQFLAEDPSDPRAAAAKQQIQSLQAQAH